MAEQNQNLKIPDVDQVNLPQDKVTEATETTGVPNDNTPVETGMLGTKEIVISAGVVLVAAIFFFIIKNYVSKMLVASYKKSPSSADMAGWGLFCILLLASIAAVLGILDSSKFMTLPYLIPIGLAIIASFIMFIMALFSKR